MAGVKYEIVCWYVMCQTLRYVGSIVLEQSNVKTLFCSTKHTHLHLQNIENNYLTQILKFLIRAYASGAKQGGLQSLKIMDAMVYN